MKRFLLLFILILAALNMSAQVPTLDSDTDKQAAMREKLGIDYSMPDFDTKKIDDKVIGVRLARMLEFLQKNYMQGTYNRQLANIRYEATEESCVRFLGVDKLKIERINKVGDVITVRVCTITKNEQKEILKQVFNMVFTEGVSNSDKVNELFLNIGRYLKEGNISMSVGSY